MTKQQLEHILRASAGITGGDTFVVIGSQAILGQFPEPPAELAESIEADVFSFRSRDDANLIDGSIGEESPFHRTFGYFAHGVAEETAILPTGWKDRLIPLHNANTGTATGLCLEVHDLAVSKLVAGRDKDIEYLHALLKHRLADMATIKSRLAATTIDGPTRQLCELRLRNLSHVGL